MARVTDSEVKAIVDTERDTLPFIDTATLIVDEDIPSGILTDERLKQVELYLTAHFVTLVEERGNLRKTRIGDSSEEYDNKVGVGLLGTRYGQQAIALDTTGTLRGMSTSQQSALFEVV